MSTNYETAETLTRDNWDRHWRDYNATAERNPAQRYRRQVVARLLRLHGKGEGVRLLDIGSGQGDLAQSLQNAFPAAKILGLELSSSGVEISRRKVPTAEFVQCNLLERTPVHPNQQHWATHAVCSEVIEHVDDPCTLLKNARDYMAPGCRLIITAPGGPISAFDRHIGHRKHWTSTEIEQLMRDAGYVPEHVTGAGFPFFNLYRCVVILRGEKLIADVTAERDNKGLAVRAAMSIFRCLMRRRLNSSRRGWQMLGVCRVPD